MNKYAIIKVDGKQFIVNEGTVLKLNNQKEFTPEVLYYFDGKKADIGTPVLTNVKVTGEILESKLDKKINVSRYKSKSRYRRNRGHRQPISMVKVNTITKGK
jgi:large subunit ribosomal protein L21